jgi:hypothetical protein
MMRRTRRLMQLLVVVAFVAALAFGLYVFSRARPQDVPWTSLDLGQPVGIFTGRKITALGDAPDQCRALLNRAGARFDATPPFGADQCLVEDGLKLAGGARRITLLPENPRMACPVAAGLAVWEWEVVQPAARRIFGKSVAAIEHLGTWNCRRIAGSKSWSQHSTANAIDVAAFRLADGTVINVLHDWKGDAKKAEFLRTVRDGACDLFSTVLSPDYNAAHADHLHIDQARRGAMSRRPCR